MTEMPEQEDGNRAGKKFAETWQPVILPCSHLTNPLLIDIASGLGHWVVFRKPHGTGKALAKP